MIHVGDLSREKRIEHPKDVLKQGQTVKAVVLELDKSRRRIRLGMKQLEPTNADNFIAEHKVGETVTGRIVDVRSDRAKIELGEGVTAECVLAKAASKQDKGESSAAKVDVSALSAMLNKRWKSGQGTQSGADSDLLKPGQIRSFRITSFDPSKKRIELEIAS
jgi:small subunit ribosomal protein S1